MSGNLLFIVLELEKSKIIFLQISCSVRALFLRDHTVCPHVGMMENQLTWEEQQVLLALSQLSSSLVL